MTDRASAKSSRGDGKAAPAAKSSGSETEATNSELRKLAEQLPLWRRPGYLIRRLHQLHYALFFEECAGTDITPVQYGLMTILSTNPDSDQIAIANALGIDRTNVADVLRRLHQAGLVKRERSEKDKRAVISRLTPAGEALLKQLYPAMARAQERLLECLEPERREAFLATLMELLEANNKFGRASLKVNHKP